MRYLYYCNSSYQLINVLNLHWHRRFSNYENINDYSADLIMLNAYSGAEQLFEIIKNKNIFENVYLVDRVRIKGRLHVFKTFRDLFLPVRFLTKYYSFSVNDFLNRYSAICVPKINRLVLALWQTNKNAEFQIYEDGLATYTINYDNSLLSKSYKIFYKILNQGRDLNDISSIYLNNISLYKGNRIDLIEKIPELNNSHKKELLNTFNQFAQIEDSKKCIYWLAQIESIENDMCEELKYLSKYNKDVVYCPHPRNNTRNIFNFDKCIPNQIWELKVLNMENISDMCFISSHSTAIFSPYALFSEEPYLIFTYRLLKHITKEEIDKYDYICSLLKEKYKNTSKIMIPKTLEEFKECIKKFKNETRS